MGKVVFIAEKPSVAQQFAQALDLNFSRKDGFLEAENTIVTWCVGHLVTMCYPEKYDEKYRRWSLSTLPFIPEEYKYEVIEDVKKQFGIVRKILTDPAVETIYVCADSGREGEYIYRLVARQAGVTGKKELRVWIDSQTREEIRRGIREAQDEHAYDALSAAAYLRAKEDYLMGINFSRALTLKYADGIKSALNTDRCVIAVGRVMTCVLGIIVRREREIRAFVKTPFYRVQGQFGPDGVLTTDWQVSEKSRYYMHPMLYRDNGFLKKELAQELIRDVEEICRQKDPVIRTLTHKKETKNPPLLYNLAELQNDCSRFFKISPDETLQAAQELYEKKLTTYPRTDARVLSSAVAKEITKNLKGLGQLGEYREYVRAIEQSGSYKTIGRTRYTNDKAITDHYAIIPTGQGLTALNSCSPTVRKVYELIVRRFLAVFYPAAVFDKMQLVVEAAGADHTETFQTTSRTLLSKGYLEVMDYSFHASGDDENSENMEADAARDAYLKTLKKGMSLPLFGLQIKEGETTPPKRYNSGSIILTMENAGQFIEEEELREQIRGSGIGTSATRAEILKKLVRNRYLDLNKKTQILTPTLLGEMIYDTVDCSIRPLLDPKLTASWEMGLTRVAAGEVTEEEYLSKLNGFVSRRVGNIKEADYKAYLQGRYREVQACYPKPFRYDTAAAGTGRKTAGKRTSRKQG